MHFGKFPNKFDSRNLPLPISMILPEMWDVSFKRWLLRSTNPGRLTTTGSWEYLRPPPRISQKSSALPIPQCFYLGSIRGNLPGCMLLQRCGPGPLKLTAPCHWKWMVGNRIVSFLGAFRPIFRGKLAVRFRVPGVSPYICSCSTCWN